MRYSELRYGTYVMVQPAAQCLRSGRATDGCGDVEGLPHSTLRTEPLPCLIHRCQPAQLNV